MEKFPTLFHCQYQITFFRRCPTPFELFSHIYPCAEEGCARRAGQSGGSRREIGAPIINYFELSDFNKIFQIEFEANITKFTVKTSHVSNRGTVWEKRVAHAKDYASSAGQRDIKSKNNNN